MKIQNGNGTPGKRERPFCQTLCEKFLVDLVGPSLSFFLA
jgi:hypothetical protein